jgi:hypothetical protein
VEDEEGPRDEPAARRTWRRIFEEDLRALDVDLRIRLAREASGETLRALCFDPASKVVTAVLENAGAGLEHARLIAEHHRTGSGLDVLGKGASFLRDQQVERCLFRNPQTSERLLRRIFQPRRMAEVYRLCLSRDATERVRAAARKELRDKFTSGTADERVNLIVTCEGRCLDLLLGVALDSRAAALLCRRPLHSTLLVRNLARWPSTPPEVLVHLARQPVVKRSPALRDAILRHPNAPSHLDAKSRPR